jgi:K+-transporting ATPase ATPase C chain
MTPSSVGRHIRPAIAATVLLCVLTGVLYPTVVTALAQLLFPRRPTARSSSAMVA